VVAADERDSVGVSYFETEEEEERLERVEAAVNKVACPFVSSSDDASVVSHTHEEVVCVWDIAANAEQLHEVMKLTVNISAYL
jgi:hypothetical protein